MFLAGVFLIINSLTVEVSLLGVRKKQRIFGFLLEEMIDADRIVDIVTEKNASSRSGNMTRVWFRLKLITSNGNGHGLEVGDSLEGESYAQEIREKMIASLGMTWRQSTLRTPVKEKKKPLPLWVNKLRHPVKLLSYAFPIALVYDLREFIFKLFNFLY